MVETAPVPATPARVLLVEDEPLIAMMLEDFLDALGCRVAGSAECVANALELIEAGDIDAAILDVNLRGGETSGAVADALADRDIPFILATGGGAAAFGPRHSDRPLLAKPFTMDAVQRALTRIGVSG